jgi:transposase
MGARIHSRYQRTVADVAFGRRQLVLKLVVRKWICRVPSCAQRIFAERFPDLVGRYARMTERLMEVFQTVGVTTNGADAARMVSSLGMPTSAKTIIRQVLRLPLPDEGSVSKVGIDEWAWKKGSRYGTILVDLEQRRVVQLLADRSVATSQAWLRTHPEIELISRDRGKIFREAATYGAPQAQQVVDRFHLQKNFAEAVEKVVRKRERVLKQVARSLAGNLHPAWEAVPEAVTQERRARHRQRVSLHKRIWKRYRQGCYKEQIAHLVGVSSRTVYRVLEQETPPPPRRRARSASIVDPYLAYVTERWNQGCHSAAQLYEEIVAQGYAGTKRTLQLRLRPFRYQRSGPVSKQVVIWDKPPSPRGVALMMVRPAQNRTREQVAYLDQLVQSDETIAVVFTLAQGFGTLLRTQAGQERLESWKAAVQASGIAELAAFVEGLADDEEAVSNGCRLPWSNGVVEGFVNKAKWIKRSSYGQAGFPLLQRRILLHPKAWKPVGTNQGQRSFQRFASPGHTQARGADTSPTASAAA